MVPLDELGEIMKRKLVAAVLASTFLLGTASVAEAKESKKKGHKSCKYVNLVCKSKIDIEL
jgi:hypothetical protein